MIIQGSSVLHRRASYAVSLLLAAPLALVLLIHPAAMLDGQGATVIYN